MIDEYSWLKLRRRYHALGRRYLELAHVLRDINKEIAVLRTELREAQSELARLRALDTAQRTTRDEATPLQ